MEFQNMKRRELQSLCKRNNIPANLTNAAMSHSLSLLPFVEGLDELLRNPTASEPGSPESSVISTPAPSRTSTRPSVTKQETGGGSVLPSRTRYGTRSRAVGGTETGKTPATRTTRTKASQKQMDTDMQAAFEADMGQSEASVDNDLLADQVLEISEAVSELRVNCEEQSGSKKESDNNDVVNNAQEVINVDDDEENDDGVNEDQQEIGEVCNNHRKVDFHALPRRDLQSLSKKNKIPANTSNATMADALESLAIVEGLEEFLRESNSQAPDSPTMSQMTTSCARRTWTTRKITKEPTSSKLLAKSCRGSRKTVVEKTVQEMMTTMSDSLDAVQEMTTVSESVYAVEEKATMSESADVVEETTTAETVVVVVEKTTISETPAADQETVTMSETANVVEEKTTMPETLAAQENNLSVIEAAEMEPEVLGFASETTQDVVTNSDESKLPVFEAVETEEHEAMGFSSEANGNSTGFNEENSKHLEDSETEEDACSEDMQLEVPEQLQSIGSAGESKNAKDFGSDSEEANMGSESEDECSEDMQQEVPEQLQSIGNAGESKNTDEFGSDSEEADTGSDSEDDETRSESDGESEVDEVISEEVDQFTEITSLTVEPPVFENNVETAMEMDLTHSEVATQLGHDIAETGLEIPPPLELDSTSTDLAAQLGPFVPTKRNNAEEENLEKLESQVTATPLDKKSMRKLKRLLKEKLQEANALANELENLSLEDKVVKLPTVEEGISEDSVLYPVDKLLDNMISEEDVTGLINVGITEKNSSITPSKTLSVAGSDVNKENYGTESAKIPVARSGNFPTDMSMIKLKKALQQQSEKRQALHKLSDNCHPLVSPVGKISVALAGEDADSRAI